MKYPFDRLRNPFDRPLSILGALSMVIFLLFVACSTTPRKPAAFIDVPVSSERQITEVRKALIVYRNAYKNAAMAFAYLNREFEGVDTILLQIEDLKPTTGREPVAPPFRGWADTDRVIQKRRASIHGYEYHLARRISAEIRRIALVHEIMSVMILGDAKIIPPSYYFFIPYTDKMKIGDMMIEYNDWIASDSLYASKKDNLTYDWAVGRIPVNDPRSAMFVAQKYYAWYRLNKISTDKKFIYAGGNMFNDARYVGEMFQLDLQARNGVLHNEINYFESQGRFLKSDIRQSLNTDDAAIMLILSHGNGDGIGLSDGWLHSREIMHTTHKPGLPILLTPACMDGRWDTELIDCPHDLDGMSVGEAIILSAGAGIGYLGGTRICVISDLFRLEKGRVRNVRYGFMTSLLADFIGQYLGGKTRIADALVPAVDIFESDKSFSQLGKEATLTELTLLGNPVMSLPTPPKQSKPDTLADLKISQPDVQPRGKKMHKNTIGGMPGTLPRFLKGAYVHISPLRQSAKIDVIHTENKKILIKEAIATRSAPVKILPPSSGIFLVKSKYSDGTRSWHYFMVE